MLKKKRKRKVSFNDITIPMF